MVRGVWRTLCSWDHKAGKDGKNGVKKIMALITLTVKYSHKFPKDEKFCKKARDRLSNH